MLAWAPLFVTLIVALPTEPNASAPKVSLEAPVVLVTYSKVLGPPNMLTGRPPPRRFATAVPRSSIRKVELSRIWTKPVPPTLPTPDPLPTTKVPPERVIGLTKTGLATPRVVVPAPTLFRVVAAPVASAVVVKLIEPPPANVSEKTPLMAPVRFNVAPASAPMVTLLPIVMAPLEVLVPATACKEPPLLMPLVLRVRGSAIETLFSCNAAPTLFGTVVPAVARPSAPALLTRTAPSLIVKVPFQVLLLALISRMPLSFFVTALVTPPVPNVKALVSVSMLSFPTSIVLAAAFRLMTRAVEKVPEARKP